MGGFTLTDLLERARKSKSSRYTAGKGANTPIICRHLGLNFAAPFRFDDPLPAGSLVDVTVTVEAPRPVPDSLPGAVLAQWAVGDKPMYTLYEASTGQVLRFHGLCEFHLSKDASAVRCFPGPTCDEGLLQVFMAGTVTALLLVLRGRAVLHASAVRHSESTILFTGRSGTGKTTIAALCCAAGAQFVSDDVVSLEAGPGGVACVGLSRELRLREQAQGIADLFSLPLLGRRITADARLALSPTRAPDERNVVTAVVLPHPARWARHVELRRLCPSEAVAALVGNARIPCLVPLDLQRAHFETVAQLAAEAPVFEAIVPWGLPFELSPAVELLDLVTEERGHL